MTAAVVALAGAGCNSLTPAQFASATPRLDPAAYFTGQTSSRGVFENRAGEPARRFTSTANGHWEGGALTLDQAFVYEDGKTQERHWRIRRLDAHRFEATANDVAGIARGEAYGNAFRWEYTVALSPGNPLMNVHLTQWMYLEPGGRTMVNRATIKKFGVELAQVTEYFVKE